MWKKGRPNLQEYNTIEIHQNHTNFPVENDDNIILESSLPLMIIVLSIAEVTQITAAMCSLKWKVITSN